MTKFEEHLKHLMFYDCVSMSVSGCNHNAGDRCSVYEIWYDHIRAADFDTLYETYKTEFEERKELFEPGYYKNVNDIERYATEHGENAQDYINYREHKLDVGKLQKPRIEPPASIIDDDRFLKSLMQLEEEDHEQEKIPGSAGIELS